MKAKDSYFLNCCWLSQEQRNAVSEIIRTHIGEQADRDAKDMRPIEDFDYFDDILYRISYEIDTGIEQDLYTYGQLKKASDWVRKYRSLGTDKAIICRIL